METSPGSKQAAVVYFDQRAGALYAFHCSKSLLSIFTSLSVKKENKEENQTKNVKNHKTEEQQILIHYMVAHHLYISHNNIKFLMLASYRVVQ